MAKQTNLYQPTGFNCAGITFTSSDATTIKDIISAGPNDSVLINLSITSNYGQSCVFALYLNDGTTDFLMATITIPSGCGTNGVMPPLDSLALGFLAVEHNLPLKQGWKLRGKMMNSIVDSSVITIMAITRDY